MDDKYYPEIIDRLAKQYKLDPKGIRFCLDNKKVFPCFAFELKLEYNYWLRKLESRRR